MDQVEQIREKIDIVALISEVVPLKKLGRNFKANCPFHQEKTPSFVVSPERQIWHCFGGCGKGGDAFTFIMEYEHVEFPEALRVLAQRAGVQLTSSPQAKEASTQKELLYQINSFAKEFYHFVLTKHKAGEEARAYLANRGISQKVIETFALGFAPSTGSALVSYLVTKKHFTKEDLIKAGLGTPRGRDVSDFFRGRLIFPLIDHRDNVVGFSGRIIEAISASGPKYINTRETLAYHKSEHFYGLSVTKDAIRKENQVIVTEGEFDVISCFQNGIGNVVGVKGTALTEQHVQLLARFAQKVTFAFDGDRAGQEAIKRSVPIVEKKGLLITVVKIPGGKDPDEALKNEPALFKKAVREDTGVYDYLLDKVTEGVDLETAAGKKQVSEIMLPFLSEINNEIVKEHYVRKISGILNSSYESVARELERFGKTHLKRIEEVATPKQKRSKEEVLEEYLLALILQSDIPKQLLEKSYEIFGDTFPEEQATQKLFQRVKEYVAQVKTIDMEQFGKGLPQELLATYNTCVLYPISSFGDDEKLLQEVEKTAQKLATLYVQKRMRQLAGHISEKEARGEDVSDLQKEYSALTHRLETS